MKAFEQGGRRRALLAAAVLGALSLGGCQSTMRTMGMGPPMGSPTDVADARHLWAAMKDAGLVGPGAVELTPYKGTPPHGAVLETTHRDLTVNGHRGLVIVKRNYRGPDVSVANVEANPDKYLKSVTVMYKREPGYDPDDKDWFWAKYKPDGSLYAKKKMGMEIKLAGRVAKGKPQGCIACHRGAPGGDFVFSPNIHP